MNLMRLMRMFGLTPHELLIAAVLAAPTLWVVSFRFSRVRDARKREDARRCASDVAVALAVSIQICENIWVSLQSLLLPNATIQEGLNVVHAKRQMLRGYMRQQIPLSDLIPIAAAAERQLSAACDVMSVLRHPSDADVAAEFQVGYDLRIYAAQAQLKRAVDRLRRLQPDLARAVAKVDGGWATLRRARPLKQRRAASVAPSR
jgi:hypothetical protein